MAKQPQAAPTQPAAQPARSKGPTVTYVGDVESVQYAGQTLKRGEAVQVDEASARRLLGNQFFEVSGVEAEPQSFTSADDALEAERAQHKQEIEELTKLHADEMEKAADSLKAGWKQQHDAMQAEIDDLKKQLAGPI